MDIYVCETDLRIPLSWLHQSAAASDGFKVSYWQMFNDNRASIQNENTPDMDEMYLWKRMRWLPGWLWLSNG